MGDEPVCFGEQQGSTGQELRELHVQTAPIPEGTYVLKLTKQANQSV
jgi:hypothetical protein